MRFTGTKEEMEKTFRFIEEIKDMIINFSFENLKTDKDCQFYLDWFTGINNRLSMREYFREELGVEDEK